MAWYYSWSTSLWNPPSLSWCSGIVMATFTYLPRPHIGGLNYKGEAAKATTHRKGSRNGRAVQRLVPNDFGGIGEKSPSDSTSKEDDNTNKPGLNHVHGSTRETGTYGDPGLDRAVNVIQPRSLFLFHVLEHSSHSTAWTRQTRRAHGGGHTGRRGKKLNKIRVLEHVCRVREGWRFSCERAGVHPLSWVKIQTTEGSNLRELVYIETPSSLDSDSSNDAHKKNSHSAHTTRGSRGWRVAKCNPRFAFGSPKIAPCHPLQPKQPKHWSWLDQEHLATRSLAIVTLIHSSILPILWCTFHLISN